MTTSLPRVYPITDTRIAGISHTEQVRRLVDGGARFIQIREKRSSPRAFFDDAVQAVRLARSAGAKIIINDRVDIALAVGANGVHLGQTDMPINAARRLLGEHAIIGFSTHNQHQVEAAANLQIDYLAFGPVYDTTTKENPDPVADLTELRTIKAIVRSPIVAIGGITESNMRAVFAAGADSVAVISAVLCGTEDIASNMRNLTLAAEKFERDRS